MAEFSDIKLFQRRLTGFLVIAGSIIGILCLYYLKYLPERQNDFHRSAFRELAQIQQALKVRNQGYLLAIDNYTHYLNIDTNSKSRTNIESLDSFFTNNGFNIEKVVGKTANIKRPHRYTVDQAILQQVTLTKNWELKYVVHDHDESVRVGLAKNLDSILNQLIFNYKDIFNDFILIRGKPHYGTSYTKKGSALPFTDEMQNDSALDSSYQGEIIYNSGNLSMDYLVRTDSLFKNGDGFNQLNIKNETIEGNSYKLFLYPFQLGRERVILSGLISFDNYYAGYQDIPLSYLTFIAVLVLLFVIYLPILKVFKMTKFDRVTDLDIRLLIATYFIGAFLICFMLLKLFLDKNHSQNNRENLSKLSDQVKNNFRSEVFSICQQLRAFDSSVRFLSESGKGKLLQELLPTKRDGLNLNPYLRPRYYPYLDNVFWIDSTGTSRATWAYKTAAQVATPSFDVKDRQYFTDFVQKRFLIIGEGVDKRNDTLTVQPTLDKLDGEYTINVVIQSDKSNDKIWDKVFNPKTTKLGKAASPIPSPMLIGLSSKMYSVYNPILPPGYSFSIVNEDGQILYDSKPGRALLSNLLDGIQNPEKIYQGIRYRSDVFNGQVILRGREVSLLATPIKDFPYTLIIYCKNTGADGYEEHLIISTAFITFFCLIGVLLSGLLNQLFKRRQNLHKSPVWYFEWLYPLKGKKYYYRYLFLSMVALFCLYLFFGAVAGNYYPQLEYSIFFITLLFPFFIAFLYFLIRKEYQKKQDQKSGHPRNYFQFQAIMAYLIIVVAAINFLYLFAQLNILAIDFLLLLYFQIIAFCIIFCSSRMYKKVNDAATDDHYIGHYVTAILTGVFMISIVPAIGIFCLIFRQEKSLKINNSQLYLARNIHLRGLEMNRRTNLYKYGKDQAFDEGALDSLKFYYGIYTLNFDTVVNDAPKHWNLDTLSIVPVYSQLHDLLFTGDSITLEGPNSQYIASDSSWYFRQIPNNSRLVYKNSKDGYSKLQDSIRLNLDASAKYNSFRLLGTSMIPLSSKPPLFFVLLILFPGLIFVVAYFLSRSIVKRLFVIDLYSIYTKHADYDWKNDATDENNKTFQAIANKFKDNTKRQSLFELPEQLKWTNIYEQENKFLDNAEEEKIFYLGEILKPRYQEIWNSLEEHQKFVLFDFAQDGFTNYKADYILISLLNRKILRFEGQRLCIMTPSFREYILRMADDEAVVNNMAKANKLDYWKMIRAPFLLLLTFIGIFIFVTQQETYQKITGLLATLGTLIPLISSMFNLRNGNKSKEEHKKQKPKTNDTPKTDKSTL